jgi:hypothetical protein
LASAITITIDIIDRLIFITLLLKGIRCDDDWGDVDYQDEGELLFDELDDISQDQSYRWPCGPYQTVGVGDTEEVEAGTSPQRASLHQEKLQYSDMKTYDVVLTTYGKLASEYKRYVRHLEARQDSTHCEAYDDLELQRTCPLLHPRSKFYRVILDEAQCIKNRLALLRLALPYRFLPSHLLSLQVPFLEVPFLQVHLRYPTYRIHQRQRQ